MNTTMESIRAGGLTPAGSDKHEQAERGKRIATMNDKFAGTMLANQVLGFAKSQAGSWFTFAKAIRTLTHEGREAFLNTLKQQRAEMTKAQAAAGINAEIASRRSATFEQNISNLRTICTAWQNGATDEGWLAYVNSTMEPAKRANTVAELLEFGAILPMLEYARQVNGKTRSRAKKTYFDLVRAFLDNNAPDPEDKAACDLRDKLVAIFNESVK